MTAPDRAEAVRGLFHELAERSRELRDDLMRENERLRGRVQSLESDIAMAESMLEKDVEVEKGEHERLSREALSLAEENLDLARRYADLEEHATSLANLYAATFQLHVTLDPAAVVRAIADIAINLIGAGEFVVYLVDDVRNDFVIAAREGDLPPNITHLAALTHGLERDAVARRQTVFAETNGTAPAARGPICCTPLFLSDRLVGVLTIYALLSHKKSFSELDRKLFDLVGEQAAVALVSSQCYVSVDRKLKTVQKFLDLVKS
ncbi:MAG TPA: GAF domain-containing protein [Thermoanaerobaculia bacterium]|nr:GAF domain-containing protein [Thermoanaerobaculia bacterium]